VHVAQGHACGACVTNAAEVSKRLKQKDCSGERNLCSGRGEGQNKASQKGHTCMASEMVSEAALTPPEKIHVDMPSQMK
jgi:hypothetical protein